MGWFNPSPQVCPSYGPISPRLFYRPENVFEHEQSESLQSRYRSHECDVTDRTQDRMAAVMKRPFIKNMYYCCRAYGRDVVGRTDYVLKFTWRGYHTDLRSRPSLVLTRQLLPAFRIGTPRAVPRSFFYRIRLRTLTDRRNRCRQVSPDQGEGYVFTRFALRCSENLICLRAETLNQRFQSDFRYSILAFLPLR